MPCTVTGTPVGGTMRVISTYRGPPWSGVSTQQPASTPFSITPRTTTSDGPPPLVGVGGIRVGLGRAGSVVGTVGGTELDVGVVGVPAAPLTRVPPQPPATSPATAHDTAARDIRAVTSYPC